MDGYCGAGPHAERRTWESPLFRSECRTDPNATVRPGGDPFGSLATVTARVRAVVGPRVCVAACQRVWRFEDRGGWGGGNSGKLRETSLWLDTNQTAGAKNALAAVGNATEAFPTAASVEGS